MCDLTNACAAIIGQYWAARGYDVRITVSGGSIITDMTDGLPRGYTGPLTKGRLVDRPLSRRKADR
jgi:hypothetical protein